MTASQFDALAALLRLRKGGQREAARLVLVEGLAPAVAADQAGITRPAVSNVLKTCRRGMELVKAACTH